MALPARALTVLVLAGFLALLVFGLIKQSPNQTIDDALASGRTVQGPGFDLDVLQRGKMPPALAGVVDRATRDRRVALAELRGTPVVLNFWASWCVPCRVEAPRLERAWRREGPRGVLFLGLNMQDVTSDARAFLREFSVGYLNVREADKTTARRYGATGLPETYFLTRRGRVAFHVVGVVSGAQLERGIAAARSGRPLPARAGGARRPAR